MSAAVLAGLRGGVEPFCLVIGNKSGKVEPSRCRGTSKGTFELEIFCPRGVVEKWNLRGGMVVERRVLSHLDGRPELPQIKSGYHTRDSELRGHNGRVEALVSDKNKSV